MSLPQIECDPIESEPNKESLPEYLHSDFAKLQEFLFKKQILTLEACSNCQMAMDSSRRIVFVGPMFLKEVSDITSSFGDPRDVILFALTHEISHFLYEISVQEESPRGYSLNGNKSLCGYSNSPTNYISAEDLLLEMAKGHVEVDFIASIILKKMGIKTWLPISIRYFESEMKKHETQGNSLLASQLKLRLELLKDLEKN